MFYGVNIKFSFSNAHNLFMQIEGWLGEVRRKKLWKGFWLIWNVTVIWRAINDKVFNDVSKGTD
jgi:hypothetical protein